jgi:hypothetical protein
MPIATTLVLLAFATVHRAEAQGSLLDRGYRHMYNLDFADAHRAFRDWERAHPEDPMGPVSDAAAYLFSEFDRMRILQSEFFTDDRSFFSREKALNPDPAVKRDFEQTLAQGEKLASAALSKSPNDENALLANVLRMGLHADYLALIEKRNFAALSEMKQSRGIAERLLAKYPQCYDAYLAVGVENYMLSLKPAPVRWLLRAGGAQTDKQTGIERLRMTAEHGRLLMPYARLLLAVAALRDKDSATAKRTLVWLSSEFPQNKLYREELSKIE